MALGLKHSDVKDALERIKGFAYHTPVLRSDVFDQLTGKQVFFKCENLQRGGSFKFRGAYNRLSQLSPAERKRGIVAYSSGNHGKALAIASDLLGINALVVMPKDCPKVKVEAVRSHGVEVMLYDRHRDDRVAITKQLSQERCMVLVPPFDDYKIMAGQGTQTLELLREVPNLDAIVVPVGGGGLIAGCAVAAKAINPKIKVYGVEPIGADDAKRSLETGKLVYIDSPPTIADGIRTNQLGGLTFPIMQQLVDEVVLVSDEEIIKALKFLVIEMKLVVEPTGAVAPAAAMFGRLPKSAKRIGVIISGGNVDQAHLVELFGPA